MCVCVCECVCVSVVCVCVCVCMCVCVCVCVVPKQHKCSLKLLITLVSIMPTMQCGFISWQENMQVCYNKMLWTILRPKENELKWAILVITLKRQFVMCTNKLILEGAVKCRKPFLVRLTVGVEHYSELQRKVFLEGLIVAELFKVIQDSYESLKFHCRQCKIFWASRYQFKLTSYSTTVVLLHFLPF